MKTFLKEVLKLALFIALVVVPIRYFVFQAFVVKGASMEPNFHTGEYLIIDEISLRWSNPKRGQVLVFKSPVEKSDFYIKRVIGLPGEQIKIKNGKAFLFNKQQGEWQEIPETEYLPSGTITPGEANVRLGDGEYFVMGDNRSFSSDSRYFGAIEESKIVGKVWLRAWPFNSFKKF